jgi:tripartite-type tricarboxylate transporter receptor subunit TctC
MVLPRHQLPRFTAGAVALRVLASFMTAVLVQSAYAQSARSVKIVVPFPPGGNTDTLTRLLSEQIGRTQSATVLVENRPGGNQTIGTEAVSRAQPDGNTLLISTNSFVINPYTRKLNYDPLTSFEPICNLATIPNVIAVKSASPYLTLADLLHSARTRPGELTLASAGTGGANQIAFEVLRRRANVNLIYVPYSGAAPAVTALLGDHVASVLADYAVLAEHLKSGTLRALATASLTRIEPLPDVPTFAESGYQGLDMEIWNGLFAPARTPKAILSQIADWFIGAVKAPEVRGKLVAEGFNPVGICGADFRAFIRKQHDDLGRVIRESNMKVE